MLWIICSALTAAAVLSVLWPLVRTPRASAEGGTDVAFYKAQLSELERDASEGLIARADAEAAKAEAARRLMAAADREARPAPTAKRGAAWFAAAAASIFVPALAAGLYSLIGHPALPDMPLAARLQSAPARMDLAAAVAKIEQHLAEHPTDGRGFEVLAPVYLRMGRADDAVKAYAAAIRLLGETPERLALYGEALVYAANGSVGAEAQKSFEAAAAGDPSLAKARFFLGLAAEQAGDVAHAREIWEKLLADAPDNPPWAQALRGRLAALSGGPKTALADPAGQSAGQSQREAASGSDPGPKAALAQKIQAMPEAERSAAIRGMVDNLAQRLAQNGQDIEGWLRLVRAYAVLNEVDKARAAVLDAKRNLAGDSKAAARIDALAHELGLEG